MDDIWPENMSLSEFVNQHASQILKQIIKNYFQEEKKAMSDLVEDVQHFGEALETTADDLRSYLTKFPDDFSFASSYIR
jgi:uncharacterized protein YbgA (DUF1722 family)